MAPIQMKKYHYNVASVERTVSIVSIEQMPVNSLLRNVL